MSDRLRREIRKWGNFRAWFWLVVFCGAREVLCPEEKSGSEQEYSQHSLPSDEKKKNWNPVNKNLFPSLQIAGSYIRAPSGQIPFCRVIGSEAVPGETVSELS